MFIFEAQMVKPPEKNANKSALRRETQREALVMAAENAIAAHGLQGLKARQLASAIGVSLGAIYNLVADMDELVLRVGSRTLGRLDPALEKTASAPPQTPALAIGRLVEIAIAYRRFATDNKNLWRVLFEYRMAATAQVPDWAVQDQMRLFRHILTPLALLLPKADAAELALTARTLFSAVHGIVSLGLDEKLVAVPPAALDRQLEKLVRMACGGLLAA
jgi:AcrR family transcriptional regulator